MLVTITGREIVKALGGHWFRGYGMCPCPAHDDKNPSLAVRDTRDRVLVKCFASCSQESVVDALRGRGLWHYRDDDGLIPQRKPPLKPLHPQHHDLDADEVAHMREARAMWRGARDIIPRSLGWLYLWSRSLPTTLIPPSLRGADRIYNSETKKWLPAMVAAIQDQDGKVTAVQRIWIKEKLEIVDGKPPPKGTRADLDLPKKTLGPIGAGAVRIGRAGHTLGIAEGIETALAARKLYSLPVWASLGAWRMGKLWIPDTVERIIIFADNGEAGIKAADKARGEYEAREFDTAIVYPPGQFGDFAECLEARQGTSANG
jgi:putative DNA primase/helicase